MAEKITLAPDATPEQIEAALAAVKKQFGENADIFKYEVEGKTAFLRTVDRNTYSAAAAKVSVSPAKFNEIIVTNCWLGGDEEIKKDDTLYFGLIDFVEEMMGKKKGTLTSVSTPQTAN